MGTIIACVFVVYVLYKLFNTTEIVLAVFVLGAFIVSSKTDGYIYGIIFSLLSVAAVNFAFTRPYYAFDFTVLENIISASALLVISVLISSFTIRLKKHKEKEAQVERESLRANLLRAISHDLRTPLTSISGNADNLLSNSDGFDSDTKHQIYTDIYNDSVWLTNLVENLLSVTRLEDGNMKLNKSAELIDEIITEALNHINKRSVEHKITVCEIDDIMLVDVDARLIVQRIFANVSSDKFTGLYTG